MLFSSEVRIVLEGEVIILIVGRFVSGIIVFIIMASLDIVEIGLVVIDSSGVIVLVLKVLDLCGIDFAAGGVDTRRVGVVREVVLVAIGVAVFDVSLFPISVLFVHAVVVMGVVIVIASGAIVVVLVLIVIGKLSVELVKVFDAIRVVVVISEVGDVGSSVV